MSGSALAYQRRVAFHETDGMGVLHHANYIKLFEEARVHWMRERSVIGVHKPDGPYTFAVVVLDCQYLKTSRFDDLLEVWVEGSLIGAKIHFRYAVWNVRTEQWGAVGQTELVPLNDEHKPQRLPMTVREFFKAQVSSPTWPPERGFPSARAAWVP